MKRSNFTIIHIVYSSLLLCILLISDNGSTNIIKNIGLVGGLFLLSMILKNTLPTMILYYIKFDKRANILLMRQGDGSSLSHFSFYRNGMV
ncbi:hypothetical protein HNQ80_003354 [Anaerosolibacter carboniphilus]|uniref:Uncharacterized protein n=1 Tax=Anaerosolibacter carboniphilus TaxID=1417629 RepID=A0A841L4I2_9FIRM|nr:hypothetical protein [Anaerosolibacter carboniphilus]